MRALLDVTCCSPSSTPTTSTMGAHRHLTEQLTDGWASCPIPQNGFVRIISQPRYPSPVPTALAADRLAVAAAHEPHEFWPDVRSLLDPDVIDRTALLGPRQVTDAYLLALAVHRGGCLVTLDRAVPLGAVPGATSANLSVL